MTTHYDFDAMRLNVDQCIIAIQSNRGALRKAFRWEETPQGAEYWLDQMENGITPDAKSTLAYFVAQSMEFQMSPFMSGMRF